MVASSKGIIMEGVAMNTIIEESWKREELVSLSLNI